MKTLIHNATIVNEGRIYKGSVIINNDIIEDIIEDETSHFPLSTCKRPKGSCSCLES